MVPRQFLYETGKDSCVHSGWFWCNLSEGAAGPLCLKLYWAGLSVYLQRVWGGEGEG